MRILFVVGAYKPAIASGGPVASVSGLAEALVRLGHYVTVITLSEDDGRVMDVPLGQPVLIEGVNVLYFDAKAFWFQRLPFKCLQELTLRQWDPVSRLWLKQNIKRFDVVHSHISFLAINPLLAKLAEENEKKFVYNQRGNLDPRRFGQSAILKKLYIRFVESAVMKKANLLLALSEREMDVYKYYIDGAKIQRLSNAVNADQWLKGPHRKPSLKAKKSKPKVVWFARWDLRKGPLVFVEMVHLLVEQGIDADFYMAGPVSGVALEPVREYIAEHDLSNRIELLVDIPEADKIDFLAEADLFVLPTEGEGFSMGILEAMASECCVITTPEANFPEIVTEQLGCLVTAAPKKLAECVAALIVSKEYEAYGKRASHYVAEHYTWSRIAKNYLSLVSQR